MRVILFDGGFILTEKIGILSSMLHPGRADLVQQLDGIVLGVAPEVRIEPLEEQTRPVVPAPFKVIGQSPQHRNAFGKIGKSFFLHRSGASLLPHALLKALR